MEWGEGAPTFVERAESHVVPFGTPACLSLLCLVLWLPESRNLHVLGPFDPPTKNNETNLSAWEPSSFF